MKSKLPTSSEFVSLLKGLLIPLLLWIIITPWSGELDLATSKLFYNGESFDMHPFWKGIYHYGILPGWGLFSIALTGFTLSFFLKKYHRWRRASLYLLLTLGIGSGLIIHLALKENWGRPRPRQVIEFGGNRPFQPYYEPHFNASEPSKSFASGHASMGFYFFTLVFLGKIYRSRTLYWLGWGLGWGLGILLSTARIAQGGHFLFDTMASALIMWLTAWILSYWILKPIATEEQ